LGTTYLLTLAEDYAFLIDHRRILQGETAVLIDPFPRYAAEFTEDHLAPGGRAQAGRSAFSGHNVLIMAT